MTARSPQGEVDPSLACDLEELMSPLAHARGYQQF